jgi:uncharacterized membrane protein
MPRPLLMLRELYAGRRLLLCGAVAAVVVVLLPGSWPLPPRVDFAWVCGVALFLGLTLLAVADGSPDRMRRRAGQLDERRWVIPAIVAAAAAASFVALGFLLQKGQPDTTVPPFLRILLAGLTVLGSWTLTHTVFAFHYAHLYYGDSDEGEQHGLEFPGGEDPGYWDFMYFSFVVGMTCQVSDVQVSSAPMRSLTLIHGVLSFFFNTIIFALAVNFLASMF